MAADSEFTPIANPVCSPKLALRKLVLTNFRNIARMRIETSAQLITILGPNGAGKTSLLEAISLLAPGRGLRLARIEDISRVTDRVEDQVDKTTIPFSTSSWAVSAYLDCDRGPISIGTSLESRGSHASSRRIIHIDSAPLRDQYRLQDYLSVLWLTPAMDSLFRSSASERRHFLDRLVKARDPGHSRQLAAYERAMRERLSLLSRGGYDPTWVSALEASMAAHAVAIAAARYDLITRLNQAERGSSHFPKPVLHMVGFLEDALRKAPALDVEEKYRTRLAIERAEDAARGITQTGVHRSDMQAYDHHLPASLCSNGEQKAFLIAIILAQARILAQEQKRPPILLLDEVFAHLDDSRQQALADEIQALEGQSWISDSQGASQSVRSIFPGDRTETLVLREGCYLHGLPNRGW